ARQVRGAPAHPQDRREPAAARDQHGRRPPGRLRPLRLPARGGVRLRLRPHAAGDLQLKTLRSYVTGEWVEGSGTLQTLVNPATEEPLARAGTGGIEMGKALAYAREKG